MILGLNCLSLLFTTTYEIQGLLLGQTPRLGILDPTPTDMLALASLSCYHKGIVNLTGLEYATNLTRLDLRGNEISNISALSGLTNLTSLILFGNQISDISALSGLTNLTFLRLDHNQISDISALSGLTSLGYLDLLVNQISDISALSGLTSLGYLDLRGNEISNISALSGLTNLRQLYLGSNQISDISALSGLTNLTDLILYWNWVSDISALSGLSLGRLYLRGNPLNEDAYNIYIPQIRENNPTIWLFYDPPPQPQVKLPTVETRPAEPEQIATTATINGTITDDGGASIDARRFVWGTTPSCSDGSTQSVTVNGSEFSYLLTNLTSGTTYYFKASAHNSAGWDEGAVLSFTLPLVDSFSVTPDSVTTGNSFTISYTVSDIGGPGLNRVELWRANDSGGSQGSWTQVDSDSLSGNGPVSGSFSDSPSSAGFYWYGVHVVNDDGFWSVEPDPPGPSRVQVIEDTPPEEPPIYLHPFPASSKGVWIWRVWEVDNGNVVVYKDPSAVINRLRSAGIEWVIIKCGDGRFPWENEPKNAIGWVSDAISEFHEAGIKVFGWHFVYGTHGVSAYGGDPLEEAEVAKRILDIAGIDGLVVNAEEEYDATSEETSKREQATQYMLSIRESHPEAFIAYNTFARINSHEYFPYVQFGKYCDAVMPMAYWKDRPTSPTNEVEIMNQQWTEKYEAWQDTPNRYSIKPIIPVGQSSNDPGTVYSLGSEIIEFCNTLYDYGYTDMSIYRYDKFTDEAWDAYSTCFGELVIKVLSPIDLIVTDPDGLQISKHTNKISGATYLEFDSNGDDRLDDVVVIPERLRGDYLIEVVPEPGALPDDTYTLKVTSDGETIVLAGDVAINDIPAQPYIIRSTEDEITPIIPATVDFDPDTLNLKSEGGWVTVYIELTVGHGYDAGEIDVGSILLEYLLEVQHSDVQDDMLMVKFYRQDVIAYIELALEIELTADVTLMVTGELTDGTQFEGSDTIRVIDEGKNKESKGKNKK